MWNVAFRQRTQSSLDGSLDGRTSSADFGEQFDEILSLNENEETRQHFWDFARHNLGKKTSERKLQQPLIATDDKVCRMAATRIWKAIVDFVDEDFPLRKTLSQPDYRGYDAISDVIFFFGHSDPKVQFEGHQSLEDALDKPTSRQKEKRKPSRARSFSLGNTFRRKQKTASLNRGSTSVREIAEDPSSSSEPRYQTELDVVQFIICHGIIRPDLRDEIFCQLCLFASESLKPLKTVRIWILHLLTAGCFLPSIIFLPYYVGFLMDSCQSELVQDYAEMTLKILQKTSQHHPRIYPPNWLELQAAKHRQNIVLQIFLSDQTTVSVVADSQIKTSDICASVADDISLKDRFGFSLFISFGIRVASLGCGNDSVMDAITECESLLRRFHHKVEDTAWRLSFRKEIFAPWQFPRDDLISTNLIYSQISRGIEEGEYHLTSGRQMEELLARMWFVERGNEIDEEELYGKIKFIQRRNALDGFKSRAELTASILMAFNRLGLNELDPSLRNVIKEQIVGGASVRWPLHFSAIFEMKELDRRYGDRQCHLMAVNDRQLIFLDCCLNLLERFQLRSISHVGAPNHTADSCNLIITCRNGDNIRLSTNHDKTVINLLTSFMAGQEDDDVTAIAVKNFSLQDPWDSSRISFEMEIDDVISIQKDKVVDEIFFQNWLFGRNRRTGQKGSFPPDCVKLIGNTEKRV